jgi:hypothetical protein
MRMEFAAKSRSPRGNYLIITYIRNLIIVWTPKFNQHCTQAMASSSSSRAMNVILPNISTSPYEAHQKARTFASRYVKSAQYDVAIDVLFQTARELLRVGQAGSGVDLAGFLLDVYETKGEAVSDESRGKR